MIAILVEETNFEVLSTKHWQSYCKDIKGKSLDMWERSLFQPTFLKKLHIVMVSDSFQLVIHKNLHVNLHYSVSSHIRLNKIVGYSKFSDIEVKVYALQDSYTSFEDIVVLNHINETHTRNFQEMMEVNKVFKVLSTKGKHVKKTKTFGWSIAPSGSYAQGWRRPHPDLDEYAVNGRLNKEGYNTKFPEELKNSMGESLKFSSRILLSLAKEHIILFPCRERKEEFSNELRDILGVRGDIYFEGGTIQYNLNDIEMHMDTENCSEGGYQYSSVLATKVNGVRITWIGYNRKRAAMYMIRKRKAEDLKQKASKLNYF